MSARGRITILAMLILLHSAPAWSLGLGDARVQSFIGQPLELHIDLLTAPGDDLDSVSARLASADDFALIGASREAISVPLRFTVQEGRGSAGSYILVTSRLAVNSPVLRLVVEVNWSSGRLLREYTIFLDPPSVPSQAPDPVVERTEPQSRIAAEPPADQPAQVREFTDRPPPPPGVDGPEDEQPEQVEPSEAVTQAPDAEAEIPSSASEDEPVVAEAEQPAAAQQAAGQGSSDVYGPVQSGETLWRIASNYMGQSNMDMNQVMLAIQRKNPNAFMQDNINLLKRGAVLDMPSEDEVKDLSPGEARELVAQHEAAFRMRSTLAATSTPLLASESRSDVGDTVVESVVEEPEEESIARLEIVPASEEDMASAEPGTGAVPGGEGSDEVSRDIREELARTEEALISAQQENTYLQERIAELEAQLDETQSAGQGTVADEELASLEERLEEQRLAEEEPVAQATEDTADNNIPSVTTTQQEETPWYSGTMTWIIMIIIVVAAVIGWLFNRRRGEEVFEADTGETTVMMSGIKGEAEEILRTLDSDTADDRDAESEVESPPEFAHESLRPDGDEAMEAVEEQTPSESEEHETVKLDQPGSGVAGERESQDDSVVPLSRARRRQEEDVADATFLDASSSDPEIKLDLARAYISMGDKEAARAILDEVLSVGNEQQKSEARSMMDEI